MHRLPPLLSGPVRRFLASPTTIDEAVTRFGSPLNVIFPQVFSANIDAFQNVLEAYRTTSFRICYAHKANQARAFVAEARSRGIGIDVASPGELDNALTAGFDPDQIEATGPKGEPFLRMLLDAGVTIAVDNLWELGRVGALAHARPGGARVPVLLRLSGFDPPRPARPVSRFGIDMADVDAALAVVAAPDSRLRLRGVAFHLDSGDTAERVRAVHACLDVVARAAGMGLRPEVLNIGGGFRQAFSANPIQFQLYTRALVDGLNGVAPALSWPGHTFGFHRRADGYAGVPSFHKYSNDIGGHVFLAALLSSELAGGTVGSTVAETLLSLWLEPGKALLDNAGVTIATVDFHKRLADGSVMVNLDISRDTVTPADQEVMLDPVLITRSDIHVDGGPVDVFFGGRLCLERDLITRRLVRLDRMPNPGDRVVFVNTAAYHMDLSATTALLHAGATKVVAREVNTRFHLERDI